MPIFPILSVDYLWDHEKGSILRDNLTERINPMETLTANIGSATIKHLGGKEYYVAPVTMLVEGVLNGSRGPLFYPSEEIAKVVDAWNDIPLTNGHPPVSARSPQTNQDYYLGRVYNVSFSQGKLTGEAWFDIERVDNINPKIKEALKKGSPIEVSTGLFTQNDLQEGSFNDTRYIGIARGYRPDHLAILMDTPGACSVNDGCGIFNELSQDTVREELRKLVKDGGEDKHVYVADVFRNYFVYEVDGRYFKQNYSQSKDGVALTSMPEEVIRKTQYVKRQSTILKRGVIKNSLKKKCNCGGTSENSCKCGEGKPTIKKRPRPIRNQLAKRGGDLVSGGHGPTGMRELILNACGANRTGGGGFQRGNTCAKGSGGGGKSTKGKANLLHN